MPQPDGHVSMRGRVDDVVTGQRRGAGDGNRTRMTSLEGSVAVACGWVRGCVHDAQDSLITPLGRSLQRELRWLPHRRGHETLDQHTISLRSSTRRAELRQSRCRHTEATCRRRHWGIHLGRHPAERLCRPLRVTNSVDAWRPERLDAGARCRGTNPDALQRPLVHNRVLEGDAVCLKATGRSRPSRGTGSAGSGTCRVSTASPGQPLR
jgi:hypothetical protein